MIKIMADNSLEIARQRYDVDKVNASILEAIGV
jgi:hypothetical protein